MTSGEPSRAPRLLGRQSECEFLDRLEADAAGASSRVLVLRGDAGVGKSALLSYFSGRVVGWRIASALGVESEMELAYSGLQQLCTPMLDSLDHLPVPQRDALARVFGLAAGPAPDRFLVGLATLSLLAEVAEHQPLACIVDDAHWLDTASEQIFTFVARRLLAERVALVCAARTGVGEDVLAGLPSLPVEGLGDRDARILLLQGVRGPLDAALCDQIVAESRGNPLALLELPRTWSSADVAGGFGLPDDRPIVSKIEQSYVQRLRVLPSETQLLALAAAAEPLGNLLLLHRALQLLGIDMAAAVPAVDAGLLHVQGRVEFSHPLVRSATYRAAGVAERQRVHRALAEVTDADADPDRRAWHRARATFAPNEDLAAELVRSAGRAQSRGGVAAASAFLTRAAELTPGPRQRVQRALDAAFANVEAGAFGNARGLLVMAREGPADEMQRARIELVGARLAFASYRGSDATSLLLSAAKRLEALDVDVARETYLNAFTAVLFGARLDDSVGVAEVARAALAAPHRSDGELTDVDVLLDAFSALIVDDDDTAVRLCRKALDQICQDGRSPNADVRWLWHASILALELLDDEDAAFLSHQHLQIARRTGALAELSLALNLGPHLRAPCGEISTAASMVAELMSVNEASGTSGVPYGALTLAAWRGDERRARELFDTMIREARSRGDGMGVAVCEDARAVLCNSMGQYDEALEAAQHADEHRQLGLENFGLPELIESAARLGRSHLADEALHRLARKARVRGTNWALGIEARSRALLSEGADADGHFRDSIGHLQHTRVRGELARAHLLYGEWLRRTNRRVDARTELATAYEMFAAMGTEGFAERAHRELLATGATVRKRTVEPRDHLTAQETQIARLARDGWSNGEIGAHLFISARTVEWHLRKVYTKLDISSRRRLRVALPDSESHVAST